MPRATNWSATRLDRRARHAVRQTSLREEILVRFIDAGTYTARRAWEAVDLAEIDEATVRLHWTDEPYVWHINDGCEIFVVLDGAVDMHYRARGGDVIVERLTPGRICIANSGDEHVAHPAPVARILVVERKGSI
jgi:mannose-6-phosphate isomerase-like protein (cupin superfamily)